MDIAIVGAGFGGLSAAYYLSKAGEKVWIFESGDKPGGLAVGFKDKNWKWSLEEHYHHLFVSDNHVLQLAEQIGQKIIFKTPVSSTYLDGKIYRLDSPISLLKFDKLRVLDRLRTGAVIAFLKLNPFWKPLEKITSYSFLTKTMGPLSWKYIWKPLFDKKFGSYANEINASWFWSRIKKRSASLGYPEGGFLEFAKKVEKEVVKNGGKFIYGARVSEIKKMKNKISLFSEGKEYEFNKVICTLPSRLFMGIIKNLPEKYINNLKLMRGLGAINLVLSLNKVFIPDGSYWLNVNEDTYPFLALVEHTNYMDKSHYRGQHLLYIANYLPPDHKYFSYDENKLLMEYMPYLKKINSNFSKKQVINAHAFKSPFAQPVVGVNHSKLIPPFETPIEGVYLCNIQQVYPWDRGTNYAVENGKKVADLVLKSKRN